MRLEVKMHSSTSERAAIVERESGAVGIIKGNPVFIGDISNARKAVAGVQT